MATDPSWLQSVNRRRFGTAALSAFAAGSVLGGVANAAELSSGHLYLPQDPAVTPDAKPDGPTEAPFERDYEAPKFKPSWSKPQLNRQLITDFVIFAHSELDQVKKLLERFPTLVNAAMDWGGGDWETALGGASHMGRVDIVEHLIQHGARMDLFCATMLGQLEIVKSVLTWQPHLIDAIGPHGFTLHFHAQVGGEPAQPVLDYLQSLKPLELKPVRLRRSDLPKTAPDR